jgi:hypothetical protein
MKSANYGLHGYFFKARDITSSGLSEHHYRISGKPIGFEPHGMSGSPVWLVRTPGDIHLGQAESVLDPSKGGASDFQLIFFGIVVRYLPNEKSFVAVCGETCARFVGKGLEVMPEIRDGNEHQQIMKIVQNMTDG